MSLTIYGVRQKGNARMSNKLVSTLRTKLALLHLALNRLLCRHLGHRPRLDVWWPPVVTGWTPPRLYRVCGRRGCEWKELV